ncbi:MAG: M23 family metallopeptidase, partial [Anaerolineales bacterium]|nr:M23 family metallopeptidase [Anaerolineales bacterium]
IYITPFPGISIRHYHYHRCCFSLLNGIISNPENIKIGAVVTGAVYDESDDAKTFIPPKFQNMRQDPIYVDVESEKMIIYPEMKEIAARDLMFEGNEFEKFLKQVEMTKSTRYIVLLLLLSILINPHMKTLARESLAGYRAQSYALDIVRLDPFGRRAQGLWPTDLGRYHIFGEPVYAPCAGVVAQTEGQLPDQTPPETDPRRPAGNFVRLECGEFDVLLAHLMHASLTVYPGQRVQRGHLIGRVGNSGLSTEPHLHLHAQRRGPEGDFLAGEPMPVSIDGRFLVRNSRLAVRD